MTSLIFRFILFIFGILTFKLKFFQFIHTSSYIQFIFASASLRDHLSLVCKIIMHFDLFIYFLNTYLTITSKNTSAFCFLGLTDY
jgi:hypothetical protein